MNYIESDASEGSCLDDSLEAREDIWDIQEMLFGRSARSMLNGGRLKRTGIIETSFNVTKAKEKYDKAKAAKVGKKIMCAVCGTVFVKKTYNQAFDKTKCKDRYWNTVDAKRLERALQFSRR